MGGRGGHPATILDHPDCLITGLIDPEVERRAGERRLPVVPKPFRVEMLRAAVANALETCLLIGLSL